MTSGLTYQSGRGYPNSNHVQASRRLMDMRWQFPISTSGLDSVSNVILDAPGFAMARANSFEPTVEPSHA